MLREFYKDIKFDPMKELREIYKVTQGDTKSRGLIVTLILGDIVTPAGLHTMKFFAVKPDKTVVLADAAIDGDKFIIDFTNQVLAVPGVVVCSLVLYGTDGEKIADKKFKLIVESSLEDGAVISVNERGILDRAFELAEDIVPRLELLDLIALEGINSEYLTLKPELMQAKNDAITATGLANTATGQAVTATNATITATNQAVDKIGEMTTKITDVTNLSSAVTTAEGLRVSAETGRVSAESARVLAEIAREQNKTFKKYGVRRVLGATSPLLERLYDAVGKVANVPTDDGAAVNDFDALFPWSHIRECKIASGRVTYKGDPGYTALTVCDWVVEIPKFYLKIDQDATKRDIVISQYKDVGFWTPQVFRTETGAELDKIYVGRFKTGKDGASDVSRPGLFAENVRDLASFRTGAKAKGTGWQLLDLSYVQEVLYPLYMVESANLNSQSYLGNGLTSFRYVATDLAQLAETAVKRIVVTNAMATNYNVGEGMNIGTSQGAENIAFDRTIVSKTALAGGVNTEIVFDGAPVNIAVGNVLWQGAQKTGQTTTLVKPNGKLSGVSGRTSNKYRGLEDTFGNVYEWVDGILVSERIAQVCRKPSLYASSLTADYGPVGYTNSSADGYPSEMGWDGTYPEARFPISTGAGTTTGYCDYYFQNAGLRGACFGGLAGSTSGAGLFSWSLLNAPSYTSWNIGSRLLYKPLP